MLSLFYKALLYNIFLGVFLTMSSFSAPEQPLVVYIHETIYGSQGDLLRHHCDFPCVLKPFSGADLLAKVLLEKTSGRADVIVGLEGEQALQHRISVLTVELPQALLTQLSVPFPWKETHFLPVSYAYLGFIYHAKKVAPNFDSLETLGTFLKAVPSHSIVMPDPRTSMVGRGGLSWISTHHFPLLHQKVLTYPRGWSGSRALFKSGKAAVMLGYTTSVLDHHKKGDTHVRAALFNSTPHPIQVMAAFLIKKKKIHPKAVAFLKILLSKEVQQKNQDTYGYPVIDIQIPQEFDTLRPRQSFLLKEISPQKIRHWMRTGYAR